MAKALRRGDRLMGQESGRVIKLLRRERFTGTDGWAVELSDGAEAWVSDYQLGHFSLVPATPTQQEETP